MRLVGRENQGEQIQVSVSRDGKPTRFVWRGKPYPVESIEMTWCAEGYWWLDPKRNGISRRYYRLSVISPNRTHLCVEIYRFRSLWKIIRVAD